MNSASGRGLTMRVARSRPPNSGSLARRAGLPVTSAELGDLVNNVFVNDSYAAPSPDDCRAGLIYLSEVDRPTFGEGTPCLFQLCSGRCD